MRIYRCKPKLGKSLLFIFYFLSYLSKIPGQEFRMLGREEWLKIRSPWARACSTRIQSLLNSKSSSVTKLFRMIRQDSHWRWVVSHQDSLRRTLNVQAGDLPKSNTLFGSSLPSFWCSPFSGKMNTFMNILDASEIDVIFQIKTSSLWFELQAKRGSLNNFWLKKILWNLEIF